MGQSTKPYRELRGLMDQHGFTLLNVTRDGRERWAGLTWTEDHPLIIRTSMPAHAALSVQRRILKAAGVETVDRAKKRHPQAIKDRQAKERTHVAAAEDQRAREREELAAARPDGAVVEGVTAVLTRRTVRQLAAESQTPTTRAERQQEHRTARRLADLADLDRLMRQVPRSAR